MEFNEAVELMQTIAKECDDFRSLNTESINNQITSIELKIRKV